MTQTLIILQIDHRRSCPFATHSVPRLFLTKLSSHFIIHRRKTKYHILLIPDCLKDSSTPIKAVILGYRICKYDNLQINTISCKHELIMEILDSFTFTATKILSCSGQRLQHSARKTLPKAPSPSSLLRTILWRFMCCTTVKRRQKEVRSELQGQDRTGSMLQATQRQGCLQNGTHVTEGTKVLRRHSFML